MTPRLRWAPPIVAAAAVAAVAGGLSGPAGAAPALPTKTPEQVLELLARSDVQALSGTVSQTSNLGLPQLPSTGGGADPTSPAALLSGTRTLRVEVDGADKARVQVLGRLAQTDIVRNGSDLWTYRSTDNAVTHVRLPDAAALRERAKRYTDAASRLAGKAGPAGATPSAGPATGPGAGPQTPQDLARWVVDAVEPSTELRVGGAQRVAGRPAYELQLRPRAQESLLGAASVAVDAETGLALRVRLQARTQEAAGDPAFEVGYTSLDLRAPDAARFAFTPPPGASVEEKGLRNGDGGPSEPGVGVPGAPALPTRPPTPSEARALAGVLPQVVGSGWTAAVVVPAAAAPDAGASPELDGVLASATRPVEGGRLLQTALVNLLITDDGRWVVGAVTPDVLTAAARTSR